MNKFIYPTIKNLLIIFSLAQIPVIFFLINKPSFLWISFELIIVGIILMWPLMPLNEMDERELAVHLKWKSRICDFICMSLFIPIIILSINPGINGWDLFRSFSVPMFVCFVVCSVLLKKEIGKFFINYDIEPKKSLE